MTFKIGIDPGHGGKDSGAVGRVLNLLEKDINLRIALALNDMLRTKGFITLLTRDEDIYLTLRERADLLNKAKVDLVLSIHINSSVRQEPNYISSHVIAKGGRAEQVAKLIQTKLTGTMDWPDGGVKENNFFILRETEAPAVLVELGFISNDIQEKLFLVEETKTKLAISLTEGIAAAFNIGIDAKEDLDANGFKDIVGHWAEQSIKRVIEQQLMSGYPDKNFRPENNVTRAELAAVLDKIIKKFSN